MREAIRLPPFGEGVASAEIVDWLVDVGDPVERGQDVMEVQTTKAALTVAAPVAGTLKERIAQVGEEVAVGDILGYLRPASETSEETGEYAATTAVELPVEATTLREPDTVSISNPENLDKGSVGAGGTGYLSPRARNRIDELGLHSSDLAAIRGTGKGGRVTSDDIERFLSGLESLPQTEASPARLAIADAMRRSWQRPIATVARLVDVDPVLQHRRTVTGRPNLTVYAVRALAAALKEDEKLRQRLVGKQLITPEGLGVGVAVAVDDAVLTPVVSEPQAGSLADLSVRIDESVEAARQGRVAGDAQQGVATVSNYGALGVLWATPIPPAEESCLLGVGAVRHSPRWNPTTQSWDRGTEVELTLTFDHRVADGAAAAKVMHHIAHMLEHPDELL